MINQLPEGVAFGATVRVQHGAETPYLSLPAFETLCNGRVGLGISTRGGGVSTGPYATLNLGLSTGDDPARVWENRARFGTALGLAGHDTVGMNQVHGARVAVVGPDQRGHGGLQGNTALAETDALVTTTELLPLRVLAADCMPLALCDPRRGAVAAVHAGWRGLLAGVVEATVATLLRDGSMPGDIVVGLGPCIGPCHYEVGADVAAPFAAAFPDDVDVVNRMVVQERGGRTYLDLLTALRRQLVDGGIAPNHIVDSGLCTACHTDLLYSYRAEQVTGRFALFVWLRP